MNHRIWEMTGKMLDLILSRSRVRAQDNAGGLGKRGQRSDGMIPTDREPFQQIHTQLNRLTQNMYQIVQRLSGRLHPSSVSTQDPRQEEILILLNRLQEVFKENVSALSSLSQEFTGMISLHGPSGFLARFPEAAEECSVRCQKLVLTVERLTSTLPEVGEYIESLLATTSSVMAKVDQSVRGIQRLEEETHETVQTVEEMRHCLSEGRVTVNQNVKVADHVRQTVMISSEIVKKLGARTREIGDMVKVIRNVAERTNLLALNAGIIAAQAGEDGKAFSVVADEIKALADQTTISAKNISQMVGKFQRESVQAVESIEQGVARVEEGVNSTWKVGEALDQISQKVSGVGDRVSSFSSALSDQIELHHAVKPRVEQGDELAHKLLEKWEQQKQKISELEHFSHGIREFTTEAKKQIMEGVGHLSHNPDEIRQPYESLQRVTHALEPLQSSLAEVTSGVEKMITRAHREARPSPDVLRDIQELSGQIQAMKEILSTYSNGGKVDQSHAGTVSPLRA